MILFSFFAVPAFMATAFVIILVSLKKDKYVPYVALTGSLMALFFSIIAIPGLLSGSPLTLQMEEWVAPYGITVYGDMLSGILAALAAFIALLVVIFSFHYITIRRTKYYALLCLLFAGILGVILAGDIFNLFIFMELLSIASYGLIAFRKNAVSLEASIKYLIMGSLGTSLFLLGIGLLYSMTGTLNIADIAARASGTTSPALIISFGFLLSGLAVKAGLVPFHSMHLDGYQAAPAPVSTALSGVVTTVGIYAILRISFIIFNTPGAFLSILLVLGTVSMVMGAALAIRQDNLKRLLAYSGISQMGYIAFSIGLGTALGLAGGLFHMLNHILIESLLFLSAGAVIYISKTPDLSKLSMKSLDSRILSFSFLVGVLALAGVPLFSGFASKWIIYVASLQVNPILTVFAVITSALTLAYGLKAYSVIFSGSSNRHRRVSLPLSMIIPLLALSILVIAIGILPVIGIEAASSMAAGLDRIIYIEGVHI